MKQKPNRISVGKIVAPHGIKGQVKIKSYAESLSKYDLFDESGAFINLSISSRKKTLVIATIDGVTDRNVAETFVGKELFINRTDLPDAGNDEFYHIDLLDLDVQKTDDSYFGKVKALHNFGAGDIIEILLESTGKTEMFPFNKSVIQEVNEQYIIIAPPEEV